MPTYKLIYMDVRARGELTRLAFAAAGVDFEDQKVTVEQWPEVKKRMPQGQLPVLEIDGSVQIMPSLAIARYAARECGLYGKSNLEQARVDQLIDTYQECFEEEVKLHFAPPEQKEAVRRNFEDNILPKFGKFVEKLLTDNNGGDAFFVGSGLTIGDLAVLCAWDYPLEKDTNALAKYPKLAAHRARILALPKIVEYAKTRCSCVFRDLSEIKKSKELLAKSGQTAGKT